MNVNQRFTLFNREERLVLYSALCAYVRACGRELRSGVSPGNDYTIAEKLWAELNQEGMWPGHKKCTKK
mgnify:CR=1 FL=1